jgi:thioredoxin reductase (NADPH)
MKKKQVDVLIIGAGPAGCSCALWLKQLGVNSLLLEKTDRLGGLQNESPYPNGWILGKNYSDGKAFARAVDQQIQQQKIAHRLKSEVGKLKFSSENNCFEISLQTGRTHSKVLAAYVVMATGVRPVTGGFVPSDSIYIGPGDHIENPRYRAKRVAILGGGDNAFENYQFIKKYRPKTLKIFARHVRAQLAFVKKIRKGDLKLGPYHADPNDMTVNGEPFDIFVVMYGWQGVNALEPFLSLQAEKGFVTTDEFRRTSHPRIYAIGEVTQKLHPCCVTAMADGVIAAKDIQKRIESERVALEVKRRVAK